MTKLANVIFTTQKQDKPEGVVVGGYLVNLLLAGTVVDTKVVADASAPVVFLIKVAGDYTVDVARVAETGENVSPVVSSAPFTIVPDQIDVPLSISVLLSDVPVIDVPAAVVVAA